MNIIKFLLFTILASILFFVYLEVQKTDNSVKMTKAFMSKNEHYTYKEGKQIKISNKEYLKLHARPKRDIINNNEEKIEVIEPSEIKKIILSGSIANGLSYTIKSYYASNSKGYVCGKIGFSLGIFGGTSGFYLTNRTQTRIYTPKIKNGQHHLEVPLDEFRPFIGCTYHLSMMQIEVHDIHSYGGYHKLFFPKGEASRHVTVGSPYNHNVGSQLDLECVRKDFKEEKSYFYSTCHFKSSIHSFFPSQELKYEKYTLNINTINQETYELNRFLQHKNYMSRVRFMNSIARLKIPLKDLSYFTQKREELEKYQNLVEKNLKEMKEDLNRLIQEEKRLPSLSEKEIKFLKNKVSVIEKSILANKKVKNYKKKFYMTRII